MGHDPRAVRRRSEGSDQGQGCAAGFDARLICAAVKDRDIAARTEDSSDGVGEAEILAILAKMIKQREESARIYDEAGRLDLAEQEREEIAIIRGYLPKQMSENEVEKAVAEAIGETGSGLDPRHGEGDGAPEGAAHRQDGLRARRRGGQAGVPGRDQGPAGRKR